MNPRSNLRSGIGWSASILVLTLGLLIHLMGGFSGLDGRIHDQFHRFTSQDVDDSAVLLVECHPTILDRDNPRLLQLLNTIAHRSPKVIGVVSERAPLSLDELELKPFSRQIVEGRPASLITKETMNSTGFSELSFDPQPIFRVAQQRIQSEDGLLSSFEQLLASKAGFEPQPKFVGVRFGSSIHAIPRISAARILDENFLPEMIRNRIVIIGEKLPQASGAYTPVSLAEPMPRLELRGHTVLTLIKDNAFTKTGVIQTVLMLVAFWFVLNFALRSLTHRHLLLATISIAVLSLLSCGIALSTFSTLLPASAMLMLATCVPASIWLERFEVLTDVVTAKKIKLNASPSAASTLKYEDPWQSIATALKQFFAANRIALFEIDAQTQRLKFVPSKGCVDEADIFERRRDFSRNPWQQVIDLGRAKRNLARLIFDPIETVSPELTPEEVSRIVDVSEFIVPLKSGTRIFGFMVLEMSNEDVRLWSDFENILNEFAIDFARLIGQQVSEKNRNTKWKPDFRFPELIDAEQIERNQHTIDEAIDQVEQAFESDSCCRVLVDAFGRVIKANTRMIRRLESDSSISNFDFIELLQLLGNVNEAEARNVFRTAVISDQRATIPASSDGLPGTIVVSPLAWRHNSSRDLFSKGLLIEIFDIIGGDHLGKQALANDGDTHSDPGVISDANAQSSSEIEILSAINELVAEPNNEPHVVRNNNHFEAAWQAAVFNVRPRLDKKNLKLQTSFAETQNIALPHQSEIAGVFEASLTVLADCSPQSRTLNAQLKKKQSFWSLTLRNGEADQSTPWHSPPILGAHQTHQLHEAGKKMQSIGGRLSFQDNLNGELFIEVEFVAFKPSDGQSVLGGVVRNV